jgi:hypothetical protein
MGRNLIPMSVGQIINIGLKRWRRPMLTISPPVHSMGKKNDGEMD